MHNAYVREESVLNTYHPQSVVCDDCGYVAYADSLSEAREDRDRHIHATCEHDNASQWDGDEWICDDCDKGFSYSAKYGEEA